MQAQRSIEGGHDPCQVTRIAREDHSLAHQVGAAVGAAGHVPANYGAPVSETLEPPLPDVGVSAEDAAEETIRAAIIDVCGSHSCSPLLFNQGLWYLGTHSLELLLERLGLPPVTT